MVCAHFGNIKKTDERNGVQKSAPESKRGGGGLKLFGQCPYENNTFQKGASLNNKMKINFLYRQS